MSNSKLGRSLRNPDDRALTEEGIKFQKKINKAAEKIVAKAYADGVSLESIECIWNRAISMATTMERLGPRSRK